jgi:hypothetical protein
MRKITMAMSNSKPLIYQAIGCAVSGAEEKRRTCYYSG